jgi:hypothetical protein
LKIKLARMEKERERPILQGEQKSAEFSAFFYIMRRRDTSPFFPTETLCRKRVVSYRNKYFFIDSDLILYFFSRSYTEYYILFCKKKFADWFYFVFLRRQLKEECFDKKQSICEVSAADRDEGYYTP